MARLQFPEGRPLRHSGAVSVARQRSARPALHHVFGPVWTATGGLPMRLLTRPPGACGVRNVGGAGVSSFACGFKQDESPNNRPGDTTSEGLLTAVQAVVEPETAEGQVPQRAVVQLGRDGRPGSV